MAIPLIGLLSQLGTGAVGNILEKTLPKANDAMKSMAKAPFMMLENLKELIGGKESKTPPAEQFSLKTPQNLADMSQKSPDLPQRIDSLKDKLGQIMDILANLGELIAQIGHLFGKNTGSYGQVGKPNQQVSPQMSTGQPFGINQTLQQQVPSQGGSPGGSGDTGIGPSGSAQGMSQSQGTSGTGGASGMAGESNSVMSEQWAMFEKMQSMQRAAQMFELAVKIAEVQHQAAMSAIRAIKY